MMPNRRLGAGLTAFAALCLATASPAAGEALRAPTGKEAAAWRLLVTQAETAQAAGKWGQLEKVTRQRLAIEEKTYGPDDPLTGASCSWIAMALVRQGHDAAAEPFYRRALAIDRKALGDRDPQTLLATSNLAGLLERQRRFAEAEPLRRALLDASRAMYGDQGAEAAAARVALADLLRAQSRAAEAEPLYRLAQEVDQKLFGEADPRRAADLGALAATLDDLGRHVEAEPLHRRALALRRQTFGERDAATAQAYARMGANLDAQGRHAEAEALYRAALTTDQDVRGPRHAATAADYAALGANLDAQKRPKDAEPLLRRALEIRRQALGEKSAETAQSYGALAANLAARGKAADAERLHRRALTILQASRGERDPATANAYAALAADLTARHRAKEAEPLLRKSLEIRRAVLGGGHPAIAEAYDALAENQRLQTANAGAEALAAKAVAIVRTRRSADQRAAGSDPDAAILRARAGSDTQQGGVFGRYMRIAWLAAQDHPADLPRLRDEAFTAAQDLGVSPAGRAVAQTAARGAPGARSADARVQQALAGQVKAIEGQLVEAMPGADPDKAARIGVALDAVGRELAGLDAKLQRANPKYTETLTPESLSISRLQRRLKPGEGLLLITPTGQDVYVFAVSATQVAWNRLEGQQAGLETRIRALRCGIDDEACPKNSAVKPDGQPAAFDAPAAHALYRDLVAPVEGALVGVDRLFVTSSGQFAALPLGLLVTAPPTGGSTPKALVNDAWLADRYALTTLPSIASLRTTTPAKRSGAQRWAFLGFGAPALDGPPGVRRIDGRGSEGRFTPLPGTATELRAMAKTLGAPAASLRLGAQATEASVKASPGLANAGVIAFATHGLLSREVRGVDEPGLVLTPPAKATAQDDGVLTASEAAALNLSADWVILSACNTAGSDGAPGADSLSGLARAFLYAGAHALLVSHWRVFDDSTAALTVQTLAIQRANPKLTKAQALQKAERVVRTGRRPDGSPLPGWSADWAHPAHWAPFVLISAGD